MITLNFNCIHSASFAMPKNDDRYYLNGIYLEFKDSKLNYIGTTGHTLIKVTQPEVMSDSYPMKSFIMPHTIVNAIIKQIKALKRNFKCLELTEEDGTYSLAICSHTELDNVMNFKAIDGKFPDYERCFSPVKAKDTLHEVCFNPELMLAVGKAINAFKGENGAGLTRLSLGADSASMITIGNDIPNFRAVIMPARY